MSQRPLCFVLMPFGRKPTARARRSTSTPSTGPDRAGDRRGGPGADPRRRGDDRRIIHKPMFERLILCEFAVADLTTANANVFYELGVRHAVRPGAPC